MTDYIVAFRALISAHLKAYRKKYGLSQESMAQLLHITPRSYSDIECKKSTCSGCTLMFFQAELTRDEMLTLWDAIRAASPGKHHLADNPTQHISYL